MASFARTALRAGGEVGLTILAMSGVLCVALAFAAHLFGISIIMFSTGSMSPSIPVGSAALVRSVPAAAVRIGDVVTVDRPDQLPVTHRVVGIAGSGPTRSLTLRGDANPVDDPSPYHVSEVRAMIFSVPRIAPMLAAAGHPAVLASVTASVAALVAWAFWPRKPSSRDSGSTPGGRGRVRSGRRRAASRRHSRRSRSGRLARTAAVIALTCATPMLLNPPQIASALGESESQVVQGRSLRLTSTLEGPRAGNLGPGTEAVWFVGVERIATEPGTLTVDLRFGNEEPPLVVSVAQCDRRWIAMHCPGGAHELRAVAAPASAGTVHLDELSMSQERWFRLNVRLSDSSDAPAQRVYRRLAVRVSGAGESAEIGPTGGRLASTGPFADQPPFLTAMLLVAIGASLLLALRLRARAEHE